MTRPRNQRRSTNTASKSHIHKAKRKSLPKNHLCSNCVDIPAEDARPEDNDPGYRLLDTRLRALEKEVKYRRKEKRDEIALEGDDKATVAQRRELYMECVFMNMVEQLGTGRFELDYPNRRLDELNVERVAYLTNLRDVENRWNEENRAWGLPPVFLADWTALPNDIENIGCSFKFLQCNFAPNKKLRELLKKLEKEQRDRGRQKPLIIFRDVVKGWILRAACEYSVFEHVGEYAGEVLYDSKPGASNSYDFGIDVEALHPDGKMKPLLVSALERGNEMRFASHACEPNCESKTDCNTIVFKARKRILRGEELTIDYFSGKNVQSVDDENKDGCLAFFPYCRCGSKRCRFTKLIVSRYERRKNKSSNDENIESIILDDTEEEDGDVVFVEVVNQNMEKCVAVGGKEDEVQEDGEQEDDDDVIFVEVVELNM